MFAYNFYVDIVTINAKQNYKNSTREGYLPCIVMPIEKKKFGLVLNKSLSPTEMYKFFSLLGMGIYYKSQVLMTTTI